MTEAYDTVKAVYDGHFSDDPKKAATDPLFYMLERLFFLSNEEKTMEKVDQFMCTLPSFYNKEMITKLLHYYISQANTYPWPAGHDVNG